ncbi:hypothetical protein H2199_005405 [Coniosporium tulheliwenetii]|uniref:Uncharacterized protein n=1 Tax=Coniosporium tulheliwenetii TaxID=3383036 RepID=A0ACC2Z147_9PEZI|nr:hypothetical protein H2199_005405 [Cladosporium sp. JES 115]
MTKRTLMQGELYFAFDAISSAQEAADDIAMVRSGEWLIEFISLRDFLVSLNRPECIDELEGQVILWAHGPVRSGERIPRLPRPSGQGDELAGSVSVARMPGSSPGVPSSVVQPPSVLELEGQVILWAHGPFDVVQNQLLGIQEMLFDRAASYGKILGRISLADDIPNHWQQEALRGDPC